MPILLTLIFLAAPGVQAYPTPAVEKHTSASSCSDLDNCRTLWNIVWSCLVTVLSCTWVAVHPNIPSLDETRIQVASRRLKITLVALIAPEVIILWALRQWWAARALAKKYHEYGWTSTHGFFAAMGGFMLFEGGDAVRTLYPDELGPYLRRGEIIITEEEIQDRSKGDILSKGVVIIQTGWFILQCVARGVNHLPLTELELVTLAFATLNFITYALWWKKPLSVNRPYSVSRRQIMLEGARQEHSKERDDVSQGTARSMLNDKMTNFGNAMAAIGSAVLNAPRAIFDFAIFDFSNHLLMNNYPTSYFTWHKRVPMFYSGGSNTGHTDFLQVLIPVFLLATLFGAIHCIAWSFEFPSDIHRGLWRFSSTAVTWFPPTFAVFLAMRIYVISDRLEIPKSVYRAFLIFGLIYYTGARAALLVLAFTSLRSLPDGAYQTVHWTMFIPHI